MPRFTTRNTVSVLAVVSVVAAGTGMAQAQTRAQTAQPGTRLHLQTTAPDHAAVAAPAAPRTLPPAAGFGVRARMPEPIRPGRAPLRVPPAPPMPPPQVVEPPPFFVVPLPERRRRVVIHHHPVLIAPHHYPGYYHYPDVGLLPHEVLPPAPIAPPAPAPPPEPLTDQERGDLLLHWDEPDRAISAYHEHLAEHPDDTEAMRSLGLALIDAGRIQEGVAMVALAYEKNPKLAHAPVFSDVYGPERDLRRNLSRISRYANRVDTASAWLTLAMLMQAEGRTRPAAAMLARAERAGLDPEIAGPMRDAVGRSQRQVAHP